MVFSQTAQYALRAMAFLTSVPIGEPIRVKDLSVGTGIPSHYLSKVMRRLVLAGLVTSQKGQGGGFVLSRPPEEIPFITILTAVDASVNDGSCAFGWGRCDAVHPCPLHDSWRKLSEQLEAWAGGTTLADIAQAGFENRKSRMQDGMD